MTEDPSAGRRSFLARVASILAFARASEDDLQWSPPNRRTPYRWWELAQVDRQNIRRFLKRRSQRGANPTDLDHELGVLVGLATKMADGSLSSAQLNDFDEPDTRPGRTLPEFLVFVGAEAPPCPKCGETHYSPAQEYPGWMRCHGCTFRFTTEELTFVGQPFNNR
jgi:hypothetical protein